MQVCLHSLEVMVKFTMLWEKAISSRYASAVGGGLQVVVSIKLPTLTFPTWTM